MRIGFIGCGGNARGHMKRLLEVGGAQVVAVCDPAEAAAQQAAELTHAQTYRDHRALLDRSDLDAVYISIPVFAHGAPEMDTIARGLPFLVEKPVAIDLATAREIEAAAMKAGVLTAVGYQLRYSATADQARELLRGKRMGLVTGKYWCASGAGDPQGWLRQMAKSGGQLVEQATHTIDMMRFLAGEVAEVLCYQARQVLDQIDCPDFNSVALLFANGAVGSLTTAWAYAQDWSNANIVDILFEDTRLTWTAGKLTVLENREAREFPGGGPSIDEMFVRAVRERNPSLIRSPYEDGVRSLAVSLAMNESASRNEPVKLAA